jgi:crotonobetainyl-CoA:carnitine CoA-transferase CaiB-like acyl-CoA transferase
VEPAHLVRLLEAARLVLPEGARVELGGEDPVLQSRFHAGEAAAAALALAASAAAGLGELRGLPPQRVRVAVRDAATTLLGFVFQRAERGPDLARHRNAATELYPARGGRWVHLHGGFPHLADGLLRLLGCGPERDAIAGAVAGWDAFELEDAVAERGLCAAAVRSEREWREHPQGAALDPLPAVELTRIGDAPPEPPPAAARPLAGLRVLDLTRVLAGPACGRTLASHGAEVLRVGARRLPSIEPFVVETGRGKRNAFLDLDQPGDARRLRELVRGADVFCQGYRGGALARRGFAAEALAALRPGIVAVSVDCYGHVGPWAERGGWEQLAQSASGIAAAEGGEGAPRLIPAAATDYTTGYLAAFGAMAALARRAREGGSWHVRASLCQTAMWLTRLGADLDPSAASGLGDVGARLVHTDTAWGRLSHLGPVVEMEHTPPRWELSPAPLGAHPPAWQAR